VLPALLQPQNIWSIVGEMIGVDFDIEACLTERVGDGIFAEGAVYEKDLRFKPLFWRELRI
jgi:hypothetical protein